MNSLLKILLVSGMFLVVTSCSTNVKSKEDLNNMAKQEAVTEESTKKNETKEVSQAEKENDIRVLRTFYDKGTMLDNMVGNIGYNVKEDMNSETLQVMRLFNKYFLEDLYKPLNSEYDKGLKEMQALSFGKDELDTFLSVSLKMDEVLEKGRSILLKLNADNISEVAEKYAKWDADNDIYYLGIEVGEAFSEMISTKYSKDEDIFDIVQAVIFKSMEVYGDPTEYQNLTGQEAVDSKIAPGFEEALRK